MRELPASVTTGALRRVRQAPAALQLATLCLVTTSALAFLLSRERGLSGDEPLYERMATDPTGPHDFPYAYRIAVPWLVHVLPFSHTVSFGLLASLAIAASAGVLYELLRAFGTHARLAVALAVAFALSPPLLVALLRNGRSVDPASILVLMLGCLFIVRRQRLALAMTMLAGVTVRESTLFLVPLAYVVWAERPLDRKALWEVASVTAGPAAAYLVLRSSIDAVGSNTLPAYRGPFLQTRAQIFGQGLARGTWPLELRRLASVYGPLWLLAPFALISLSFARRGLVLVALCLVSMTYALDWGRIIFLAAPVFYIASATVLKHRRELAAATIAALLALDLGYAVYMEAYGLEHGIDQTAQPSGQIR